MADDDPIDRRRFFRQGLRGLFDTLGKGAGSLQNAMRELERLNAPAPTPEPSSTSSSSRHSLPVVSAKHGAVEGKDGSLHWLRPPGAIEENSFVSACSRCGECARVCPAQCIHIEPGGRGEGAPFIVIDDMPCVMCDGTLCMYACPTMAIESLPLGLVDMGTAVWHEQQCVRSNGTDCTICVDRCPIGPRAIELLEGRVAVHLEGCTGCGVCQNACPTTPKSITITPRSLRDAEWEV